MLMNISTFDWDEDILKQFGIPKSCLPKILNSSDNFGEIIDVNYLKGKRITGYLIIITLHKE